jgi:hypothetical protein
MVARGMNGPVPMQQKEGFLNMLKYLHENGCPWNEWACANAALGGHLEVLKYLHENGCPWNEDACTNAASGGHVNIMKYLLEKTCPLSREWLSLSDHQLKQRFGEEVSLWLIARRNTTT